MPYNYTVQDTTQQPDQQGHEYQLTGVISSKSLNCGKKEADGVTPSQEINHDKKQKKRKFTADGVRRWNEDDYAIAAKRLGL